MIIKKKPMLGAYKMELYARLVRDVTFPLISIREGLPGIRKHLRRFEDQQYLSVEGFREI